MKRQPWRAGMYCSLPRRRVKKGHNCQYWEGALPSPPHPFSNHLPLPPTALTRILSCWAHDYFAAIGNVLPKATCLLLQPRRGGKEAPKWAGLTCWAQWEETLWVASGWIFEKCMSKLSDSSWRCFILDMGDYWENSRLGLVSQSRSMARGSGAKPMDLKTRKDLAACRWKLWNLDHLWDVDCHVSICPLGELPAISFLALWGNAMQVIAWVDLK